MNLLLNVSPAQCTMTTKVSIVWKDLHFPTRKTRKINWEAMRIRGGKDPLQTDAKPLRIIISMARLLTFGSIGSCRTKPQFEALRNRTKVPLGQQVYRNLPMCLRWPLSIISYTAILPCRFWEEAVDCQRTYFQKRRSVSPSVEPQLEAHPVRSGHSNCLCPKAGRTRLQSYKCSNR